MSRWQIDPLIDWTLPDDESADALAYTYMNTRGAYAPGYLRVAPSHWVEELKIGVNVPKYALLRAISCYGHTLNGTFAKKIVENPALKNLASLDLARTGLSMTFFKALRQAPLGKTLQSLSFFGMEQSWTRGIHGEHQLSALRHVGWMPDDVWYTYGDDRVERFFAASCFEQLNALSLANLQKAMGELGHVHWPSIRHIGLDDHIHAFQNLPDYLEMNLFEGISCLSLYWMTNERLYKQVDRMFLSDLSGLSVLDLSGVRLWNMSQGKRLEFFEHLANSTLCRSPQALYLGRYGRANEVLEVFDQQNIEIRQTLSVDV